MFTTTNVHEVEYETYMHKYSKTETAKYIFLILGCHLLEKISMETKYYEILLLLKYSITI